MTTDVFDYLSQRERPPVPESERQIMVVTARAKDADGIERAEIEYLEQQMHPDHLSIIIFYDFDEVTPLEPGAAELGILGGISREEYFALFTLKPKGRKSQ